MPTGGVQNSKSTLSFLDNLGSSDRGDNIKLSNTAKALVELADFVIDTATKNMEKHGSVATGKIISSMNIGPIVTLGTKIKIDINIDEHYKFVDKGVKGVESGKSYANYAFKDLKVSRKMAAALLSWLRQRGRRGKTKYKAVSKGEKRNKGINRTLQKVDSFKSLAYAVSTNIKKKGIKPTLFFTNAVKEMVKLSRKKLADGVKLDIIESLKL